MRSGRLSRSASSQVSKSTLVSLLRFEKEGWKDLIDGRSNSLLTVRSTSIYFVMTMIGILWFSLSDSC